jgi:periplasmic protein CpxP/Spy
MMNEGSPERADRMVDRMLSGATGVTEAQRNQVREIARQAATDLRSQHESGRALREQMAAAFAQPVVDAAAVEALRQQRLAQHDAASKRMTQAMLDVSRVLTPEQRQQVAQKMHSRRAMMERHRGERQRMEGEPTR